MFRVQTAVPPVDQQRRVETTLIQMLRATIKTTSLRVTRAVDFADMSRIAKKETTRTPARTCVRQGNI